MRTLKNSVYIALFIMAFALPSQAAYLLNAEFGERGVALTGFDNYDDRAQAMALQKDGKIVVAGQSDNGSDTDIAVARYNSDGSLDTTFNSDGKATFKIGSGDDGAYGVAIQDDGTIVAVGFTMEDETKSVALIRLTSAGYLDLDFGVAGQVVLTIDDSNGEARDVLIDKDNRILIGGTIETNGKKSPVAARFLFDGSLDAIFGDEGIQRIEKGDAANGNVIALQSDGKIVLGGSRVKGTTATAALFRLEENGSIDESFGDDGQAFLNSAETDSAFNDMIVLADNSVVATGYSTTDKQKNITTAKFLNNGKIDEAFGSQGFTVIALEHDSIANSIAEKEDGSFLIVGEGLNGTDSDIVLVHLDSTGFQKSSTILATVAEIREAQISSSSASIITHDVWDESVLDNLGDYELIATRGAGIPLVIDIDNENDFGRGVIVLPDGKVFAAGYTYNGKDEDFVLVSYADDAEADSLSASDSSSEPFFIYTTTVTNVTRNGAMSGGVISENNDYDCEAAVGDDCTVTARGVVYGVTSYPVYKSSTDEGDSSEEEESNSVFPDWASNTSYNYELVRSGQTSDGTGAGEYGSDITKITPNSLYYVRAYAVLQDGTVLYGNQLSFKTDDACFIATAAYGSSLERHVEVLRQFRDRYLQTHGWGRKFVRLYYQWSPPLADFIGQSTVLRYTVRLALLPLVSLSYFLLYTSLQVKILCMMLAGIPFFLINPSLLRRQN